MVRTAIKKILRYLKIYTILLKFGFIFSTAYRTSFLIQLFVEIGYSFGFILFFGVIYSNIREIAGWSFYEILFLAGLSIATSEFLLGAVSILNLRRLPEKIKDGDLDPILLKPINSLFNASLAMPYFTSFIAGLPGFFLMLYALNQLGTKISPINILVAIFLVGCGLTIAYSIMVIFASLSFVFINATTLPRTGERIMLYKDRPHDIYQGALKPIFFFLLPVVYVDSIPSATILRGIEIKYVLLSPILAFLFLTGAIKFWGVMIKRYSSASS